MGNARSPGNVADADFVKWFDGKNALGGLYNDCLPGKFGLLLEVGKSVVLFRPIVFHRVHFIS